MISDDCRILPFSEKDFGLAWYSVVIENDIAYFYVYLLDDIMYMSCEAFKRVNPVKCVWVVTPEDIAANSWTLNYLPSEDFYNEDAE